MTALVVGAPLRHGARTYNCAAVIHRGRLLGVVPTSYLPTYREFYEARHFGAGRGLKDLEISVGAVKAPFGDDLLFEADDLPTYRRHRAVRGHVGSCDAGLATRFGWRQRHRKSLGFPDYDWAGAI